MTECDLSKKCPKCFGLGRTVNHASKKLSIVGKETPGKADDPVFVCRECNGTGILLPDEVKELLEYILS